MTQTDLTQYVLPRLREVAPLDSLVYDELGQEAVAKHNEQFQGTRLAITPTEMNNPVCISNSIQAFSLNDILHKITNGRIQVATPQKIVQYWECPPEHRIAYGAITNTIAVFPTRSADALHERLQQQMLINLNFRLEAPAVMSHLKPVKANSDAGCTLERTEFTKITKMDWLTQASGVRYDPLNGGTLVGVVRSPEDVRFFCERTGAVGIYCKWNQGLYGTHDALLDSSPKFGVPIIQTDLKGIVFQ